MAAVNFQALLVHAPLLERTDQVRHGRDVLIERFGVEQPHAVAGAHRIAGEEQVMPLQQKYHGAGRVAGHADGLQLQAAEVENLALVVEAGPLLGEAARHAGEIGLGQGERHARIIHESGEHPRVVAVVVGKGDRQRHAAHARPDEVAQRLSGIVRPVDGVGQVKQQGFLLTDEQVDVRTVVEMRLVPLRVERLAGGVGTVVILNVVHVLFDDGHGIRSDFDVLGAGTCGQHCQRDSRQELFEVHKEFG